MLKAILIGTLVSLSLTGCRINEPTNPPVSSVAGVVISDIVCKSGQKCEAVIARDANAWTYQIVEGPFKKGTQVYKACAYYSTHERCSTVWSTERDQFIPPESKN